MGVFYFLKWISTLRIELKAIRFKFYAIQCDHIELFRCVLFLSILVLRLVR